MLKNFNDKSPSNAVQKKKSPTGRKPPTPSRPENDIFHQ
jgi:hypothetical protein